MSEPRVLLSAGETSGDLHGAALARALRRLYPDAELIGLAGPRMQAERVSPIVDFERLTVMGFVEVLSRLPFFLRLRRRVSRLLDRDPPDLVIPIDYPGFNLWLCRQAHERGIPVLYYIAPQVWAWRQERSRQLAACTDRVAVVFPQEVEFLERYDVDAIFVGHPLIDRMATWPSRDRALATLDLQGTGPVLGLLPGSRTQEVQRLLAPFLDVADRVRARIPDVQVVVSRAPDVPVDLYDVPDDVRLAADSSVLLAAATAALTKSGTTTVEAALQRTPFVIAHRVHPITYVLARRLVDVPAIGMVNLLAGDHIVPEFIQTLPRDRIADHLVALLDERHPERRRMVAALEEVRGRLGEPGGADRVAALATELLDDGE